MRQQIRLTLLTGLLVLFVFVLCLNPLQIGLQYAADGEQTAEQTEAGAFTLPASLRIIGEEAFEGTAVTSVHLQDGTEKLENRAFANTPDLREAYIPGSVKQIAENAFDHVQNFTVYGPEGSAADDWARKHRVPFEARDIWNETAPLRMPLGSLILLLLAALLPWRFRIKHPVRIKRAAQTAEYISMIHRKRAELFVRDLCFP